MKKVSRIEYCASFEPLQSGMGQDGEQNFIPDDEASELRKRCGTTVVGDATSGLTPLLHQFTLNSTWLLRSAPSLTGCFL